MLLKFSMATPGVYRRYDEMKLGDGRSIREEPDWPTWSKLPAAELMPRLINDLEPPAFSLGPELGELRAALERNWGRVFRMSGSGSSLFSLCDRSTKPSRCERVRETKWPSRRSQSKSRRR